MLQHISSIDHRRDNACCVTQRIEKGRLLRKSRILNRWFLRHPRKRGQHLAWIPNQKSVRSARQPIARERPEQMMSHVLLIPDGLSIWWRPAESRGERLGICLVRSDDFIAPG